MTKRTKSGKRQKADLRKNNGKVDTSMGKYYLEKGKVKILNSKGGNIMRFRNTRTSTINAKAPTLDEICRKLGFVNLKVDDRSGMNPIKRMAIWHYMHGMGVRLTDIARQSNRSHATVWSGIRRFKDYLSYGDRVSLALKDKVNEVMSENG